MHVKAASAWHTGQMQVSKILELLRKDGWLLVATRGSHHQYKHAVRPGRVAGKPNDDLAPERSKASSNRHHRKVEVMRDAMVVEKAGSNYIGHSPDLPGCVATGATIAETETELVAAIQFHLDGLCEDGLAPPPAESVVEYLFIPAQPFAPGDAPPAARP
jgi:predicted RNase H-like HicB family nuclease/predicted RNA binding protein YcfA (HicA-like mRNA interferase family)